MATKTFLASIVTAWIATITFALAQVSPEQLDVAVIRKAVVARLETLQNLSVQYELRHTSPMASTKPFEPPPADAQVIIVAVGNETTEQSFSYLHGLAMWDSVTSQETLDSYRARNFPLSMGIQRHAIVLGTDSRQSLTGRPDGSNLGIIQNLSVPEDNPNTIVERALGMRGWSMKTWFAPADLANAQIVIEAPDSILLRYSEPNQSRINEWEVSPSLGFAPIGYRYYTPRNTKSFFEIKCSDFKNVDGLMLPMSMVERHVMEVKDAVELPPSLEVSRDVATIHTYKINDPDNTPERYHLSYPPGASVNDQTKTPAK